MTPLAPGASRDIEVDPRPLFVPSGIALSPRERYVFAASGYWKDAWKVCGPTGWKLWPLQRFNRLPGVAFFCLCGCLGDNLAQAFAIGAGCEWTVPAGVAPGCELQFFANDWPSRYGNNRALPPEAGGPLRVRVMRREE
jgi:hypothetical protein